MRSMMKRERLTQIILVIVGLLNLAIIYSCIRTADSKLLYGAEERNRADVSELFYSVGVFYSLAARETI